MYVHICTLKMFRNTFRHEKIYNYVIFKQKKMEAFQYNICYAYNFKTSPIFTSVTGYPHAKIKIPNLSR